MEKHFTYPLTLTLLSLCHIDGKMSKTTMSTLMKELESVVNIPEMVDVVIAEEMFFLQLLPDLGHLITRKLCSSFFAKRN